MFKEKTLPLYGFKYGIYVNDGEGKVPAKYKDYVSLGEEQVEYGAAGVCVYKEGYPRGLLFFDDPEGEGVCMTAVSHEICHLVFFICGFFGIKVREGEWNEAYCYIISEITKEVCKELSA